MDIAQSRQDWWENVGERFYKKNLRQGGTMRSKFIADMLKANKIQTVLELGCNVGRNLAAIHEVIPDVEMTGYDIAEDAMKYAKEVEKNPATFIVGSLYDMSLLEDNSFDVVFTASTLFHVPYDKVPGIVKEMKRISSKFVFNVERHSTSEKEVVWRDDGTPHQWTADYKKAYVAAGLKPDIYSMEKLLPGQKTAGATHLICSSIVDEKFKV